MPVDIAIINATNIAIQGVEIFHCNKNYSAFIEITFNSSTSINVPTFQWNAAMHLLYYASFIIEDVSITTKVGNNGLKLINGMIKSELIKISKKTPVSNGSFVYFHASEHPLLPQSYLYVENFTYLEELCLDMQTHNVIILLFRVL